MNMANPSPLNTADKPSSKMDNAKSKASNARKPILYIVAAVLVVFTIRFFYMNYIYVETDNAYVQGTSTLLSSRVAGIIVKSNVVENQKVKMGDVLVEIKPEDFKNALAQSQSDMKALEAQVLGAKRSYDRATDLYTQGAISKERLDEIEAQYRSLDNKWKATKAQYAQAELNLDYTRILAPADGKIGRKSFEVGMLAAAGQPLFGFVAGKERWVDANFKETDLVGVAEGKPAFVSVDAVPGKEFTGVVESISPATGATFSLLPPDNATGNFTKVVQRVPVRIKLSGLTDQDVDRLQVGLSAEVKIKVH